MSERLSRPCKVTRFWFILRTASKFVLIFPYYITSRQTINPLLESLSFVLQFCFSFIVYLFSNTVLFSSKTKLCILYCWEGKTIGTENRRVDHKWVWETFCSLGMFHIETMMMVMWLCVCQNSHNTLKRINFMKHKLYLDKYNFKKLFFLVTVL